MINKELNKNLQITIRKQDFERLENIKAEIENELKINLTYSQVIAFLIRNHGAEYQRTTKTEPTRQAERPNKAILKGVNYKSQVIALKDKLNVSYARLSQLIGIAESTLKKYASGKQAPQGENLQLLNDALKKYGIK